MKDQVAPSTNRGFTPLRLRPCSTPCDACARPLLVPGLLENRAMHPVKEDDLRIRRTPRMDALRGTSRRRKSGKQAEEVNHDFEEYFDPLKSVDA